jgi:hypothetical protein
VEKEGRLVEGLFRHGANLNPSRFSSLPIFFLLYLIAGEKTGKGESATGWSPAYACCWFLVLVYVLPDECSGIYSFLLAGGVGLHRSSTRSPFSSDILHGGPSIMRFFFYTCGCRIDVELLVDHWCPE